MYDLLTILDMQNKKCVWNTTNVVLYIFRTLTQQTDYAELPLRPSGVEIKFSNLDRAVVACASVAVPCVNLQDAP